MSVIVRGMKMPKDCFECMVDCPVGTQRFIVTGRPRGCPLIEIPTPHGRLIDADKFEFEMNDKLLVALTEKYGEEEAKGGLHFSFRDCISNIQFQPTVIEAEGEIDA